MSSYMRPDSLCNHQADWQSSAQGFAYVGYKTQEAAAAALDQFNGIDFPPSSGQRLKVRLQSPDLPATLW